MCLGVPGLVVEKDESSEVLPSAVVEFAGVRCKVCIACVPDVQPGEYVIVHAGIALNRINEEEAARVFEHLREIDEIAEWT